MKFEETLKIVFNDKIQNNPIDINMLWLNIRRKRKQKINLLRKRIILVAAGFLFSFISISALSSPGVAQALKQIPIFESIFKLAGDQGMQNASNSGYTSLVNNTITNNGITLTITEVIFDGTRTSIAYLQESPDGVGHDLSLHVAYNGKVKNGSIGMSGKVLNKNQYAGVLDLSTTEELPDTFILQINITKIGGVTGNWSFEIPVSKKKVLLAIKDFSPMVTKTFKETTLTVEKVTFTPSTTEILLKLTEPITEKELKQNFSLKLFDDKGEISGVKTTGNKEIKAETLITRFKAMVPYTGKPPYIIIRPFQDQEIPQLEIEIPLNWEEK